MRGSATDLVAVVEISSGRDCHSLDRADDIALRGWLDDALGFFERHRDLLRFATEAVTADPGFEQLLPTQLLHRCTESMPRYLNRWQGPERELARLRVELLILQLGQFANLWVGGQWPVKREYALDVLLDLWSHALRADGATPGR